MLTKRHFESVARVIKAAQPAKHPCAGGSGEAFRQSGASSACYLIARDLSELFAESDSSFDADRFMQACGVEPDHLTRR